MKCGNERKKETVVCSIDSKSIYFVVHCYDHREKLEQQSEQNTLFRRSVGMCFYIFF